jgi:ribosomal protein L37AE/L43A
VNNATNRDEGKMEDTTMSESRFNEAVNRPTACPFCQGKRLDTLAKTITVTTLWRCRECDGTWTIASRASTARSPSTI